jgi:hypothetical protein
MGLTRNSTRFVLYAHRRGASFRRTATLGRQQVFMAPDDLAGLLRRYGHEIDVKAAARLLSEQRGFADPLLRLLGADEVHSFDASAYEGATDIHDFNEPLPEAYHHRFDVVLDSGSLEHIFDVRTALANCMNMVDVEGSLISILPANNFFGHGFYQFSPEFFYRALSAENGFAINVLAVYEDIGEPQWYEVPDPGALHRRVAFANSQPTYLALLATRISPAPAFAAVPQESDYVELWENPELESVERTAEVALSNVDGLFGRLKRRAPTSLRRLVWLQRDVRNRRRMERLGLRLLQIP